MISDFLESIAGSPFDAVIVPIGEADKRKVAALLERITDYHYQNSPGKKEKSAAMIGRLLAEIVGEFWADSRSFESFRDASDRLTRENMIDAEHEYDGQS